MLGTVSWIPLIQSGADLFHQNLYTPYNIMIIHQSTQHRYSILYKLLNKWKANAPRKTATRQKSTSEWMTKAQGNRDAAKSTLTWLALAAGELVCAVDALAELRAHVVVADAVADARLQTKKRLGLSLSLSPFLSPFTSLFTNQQKILLDCTCGWWRITTSPQ